MRRVAMTLCSVLVLTAAGVAPAAADPPDVPELSSPGGRVPVFAVVPRPGGGIDVRKGAAPDVAQARAVVKRWRSEAGVLAADLDTRVHALTDDPGYPQQYALRTVRAPEAWVNGDASGQVVAVIDSGVQTSHPDLLGALAPGWDYVGSGAGDADPSDGNGHGTHVAGIVAAVVDNKIGVAGAAPRSRVMPVRVLDDAGSGLASDVVQGLDHAVRNGADVINLSLGGPTRNDGVAYAVGRALDAGIPVVAAMGNEASSTPNYPAALPGVIAVGAVYERDRKATFSNTGPHLALAAPGVGILSTYTDSRHVTLSGTSMASPLVAAGLALLRQAAPDASVAALRAMLVDTARDVGAPGYDTDTGAGVVDFQAARLAVGDLAQPGAPSRFVPVEPVRILDTRPGTLPSSSPKGAVAGGSAISLPVAGQATSAGAVPADVSSVVLNVTAVGATTSTHVTAYPDRTTPPGASSLNAATGAAVPNHVTVAVGPNGAVALRNHAGSVHLVADVAGYYLPVASASGSTASLGYTAIDPVRALDTRPGYEPASTVKTRLGPGQVLDLPVRGRYGVAQDADAVVLNLTGVAATTSTHLSVSPTPSSTAGPPATSNLNLLTGQTAANLVTARLGANGSVRLRNNAGEVDLVVDVSGYYATTGAVFVPVRPLRMLDTRVATGVPTASPLGEATLALAGRRGVPAAAVAVAVNLTGVQPTQSTHVRVFPAGSSRPGVSNLNLRPGDIRANAAAVRLGDDGSVIVQNNAGDTHAVADLAGYFLP